MEAIAMANNESYEAVYADLAKRQKALGKPGLSSGVYRKTYDGYLADAGWYWFPTMTIGMGCTVHMLADELPEGRIIVRLSRRLTVVEDGVVYDSVDPRRDGTRCVYGFWSEDELAF